MRKAAPALEWQPSEWIRPSITRTALPFILALSACSTEDPSGDGEAPLGSGSAPADSSSASGGLSPSVVPLAPPNPSATSVQPVNTGGPSTTQTVPQLAPTSPPSEPTVGTDTESSPANSSGSGSASDTGKAQLDGGSTAESSAQTSDSTAESQADGGSDSTGGAQDQDSGLGEDSRLFASGLHELFIHDACSGANEQQSDTCLHVQEIEVPVEFGGEAGTVYEVRLRVRGLFEPTSINGGQTPYPEHPSFKVGGTVAAPDYSHWHIEVSDPPQTYWLNHYPQTSHTIYQLDYEADIDVAAGAMVYVRVLDANDRQIDNGTMQDLPDRHQTIEGVTDGVLDGQVLRLDVLNVQAL